MLDVDARIAAPEGSGPKALRRHRESGIQNRKGLHHARHLKRGRHLLHLGIVKVLRLLGGVLHGGEHGVAHELRIFLQKFRIERERGKLARAVDLDLHRTAAGRDVDFLRGQLGLERLDRALHFLSLFEEFAYAGHGGKKLRVEGFER